MKVRFKDQDGKILYSKDRDIPMLEEQVDGKRVTKIDYFIYSGYFTADVILSPYTLKQEVREEKT